MTVNSNVFSSKSERTNYYKLSRTWGEVYRIYHNLPFFNVFGTDSSALEGIDLLTAPLRKLTDIERQRLKKTSIDFTLCDDKTDQPILCIEFDGMQEGFNVGTSYHPNSPYGTYLEPDKWRQEITELKLKVAFGSFFPFFVVGSDHFRDVSQETKLTVVDGVIGKVLANRSASDKINNFSIEQLDTSSEEFEDLSPGEQHKLIQDWVFSVEAETELEHDPLDRLRWSLSGQIGHLSYTIKGLTDPDIDSETPSLPKPPSQVDPTTLEKRIKAFNSQKRIGTEVTIHTNDVGDVSAIAWVPNFKSVGFSPYALVENIAFILAVDKIMKKRQALAT